ncbi:MAG: hypothetical protein D6731_17940 [Planctomycetota bacterium]|nr:MAG: hypothetical protein D6731_17940 [Planctomycetota bacterium]
MRTAGLVLGTFALLAGQALAQGGRPPIPPGFNKEAILEQVRQAMPQVIENAPEETLEIAGVVKIKYKRIPTDPAKVAEALGRNLGGKGLPPGIDVNQYIGMFEKDIAEVLNEALKDVGTFEALRPIKIRSKRIPKGVHRIGIVFQGERPSALRVFNADKQVLKKAVEIRLKTRAADLQPELRIKLKEPKKQHEGREKFELRLSFLRFEAKSKSKLQAVSEE